METIGTALLVASTKEAAGPIATLLKALGSDVYNKFTSKFEACFQGHVDTTFARCSKIKNILYRDQSVDFNSQYVNISFSRGEKEVTDQEALYALTGGERLLICGTAGAGKTMFMRWTALELINGIRDYGRIPLFLEMRYFDEAFESEPLEIYIHKKTSAAHDAASLGQFISGLKSGLFAILLDAIDEVKPSLRECVIAKLLNFMREYPSCGTVISSRFDEKLESIQEFSVLRTVPMRIDQVISVIERLDYDTDVKARLVSRLKGGLYNELKEFLSNPLLATIMLLTFDHSADIPTTLTVFYQQAFEALYQRHDSAKGAYKRNHYAGLPIDRFQNVFAAFSFQTYLNYKFEFSDSDLVSAFRDACIYCEENVDPELCMKDAMECVCLIQRDGLVNVFSHRSFQEYFCALFISKFRETDLKELVDSIALMENRSNVLRMLYELASEAFEYEWALPTIEGFLAKIDDADTSSADGLKRIFGATFTSMEVGVSSCRVRSVSVHTPSTPEDWLGCTWMSVIHSATNYKVRTYADIFASPLWTNFDEFLARVPDDVRPDSHYIPMHSSRPGPMHKDEDVLELDPDDAAWLIYSNLPKLFSEVIGNVVLYRDEIVRRRSNRRFSVKNLLSKPKTNEQ